MELKYKQYVNDCKLLARSLSIYSSVSADLLNKFTTSFKPSTVINEGNRDTWKYHMNLCGMYHPIDTPIYVRSMDTMEEVLFSKENLEAHTATKEYYRFGSVAHSELLKKFPGRALLINGIIAPAKMDDVLKATTGTVLSCAYELIEEHEVSLFNNIAQWVKNQYYTRYNPQYELIHDFYVADFMSTIKLSAVGAILNFRQRACKTDEAHSFHIYAYLASNGKLHKYIDYLTRFQQLWLYRNIKYIQTHCGRQENFEWLIENLLTARNIPLAEYKMGHLLHKQPQELDPEIGYIKRNLNNVSTIKSPNPKTIQEIFDMEDPLAPENPKYKTGLIGVTDNILKNSKYSKASTKLLESSIYTGNTSNPYLLADTLINEWADLALTNRYTAYIKISSSIIGENISISVKDAFVLMQYAALRMVGVTPTYVSDHICNRILRRPTPTPQDLAYELNLPLLKPEDYRKIVYPVVIENFISVKKFNDYCRKITAAMNVQYLNVAEENDPRRRAELEILAERMYCTKTIAATTKKTTYYDYFRKLNLNIDYSAPKENWAALFGLLVATATGMNKDTKEDIERVHAAMLEILQQLSSYTIHIVRYTEGTNAIPLGFTHPRHMMENNTSEFGSLYENGDFYYTFNEYESKIYTELMLRLTAVSTTHTDTAALINQNFKYEYQESSDKDLFYDYLPEILHDNDNVNLILDSLATHDIIRLLKANKICLFPLAKETRPSTSDLILVNIVSDLTFP